MWHGEWKRREGQRTPSRDRTAHRWGSEQGWGSSGDEKQAKKTENLKRSLRQSSLRTVLHKISQEFRYLHLAPGAYFAVCFRIFF